MKPGLKLLLVIQAGLAAFAMLSFAQQNGPSHEQGQKEPLMGHGAMGGMMGQMMAQHREMPELMDKMMQGMKAINREKNPGRMKTLLKEHSALIDQMHESMMREEKMMQDMAPHMKNCPMMDAAGDGKSEAK